MQLFYAADFTAPIYQMSEEESKHSVRVLRLAEGDRVHITNGKGDLFLCQIVSANPKRCVVEVVEHTAEYNKIPYSLTIAIAPTKLADRYEWFLEKATEIGISNIIPIASEHSERKVIKHERDLRVITAAMKQSLKAYHPTLHPLTPFKEVVEQPFEGERFIAHCNAPIAEKRDLLTACDTTSDTLILIGPEGDFSPEEVQLALKNGFKEISLGKQRLRTETAAVVATTIIAARKG